MDSKLRRMTILASMAVILLAAMLVLYVNRERGERPAPLSLWSCRRNRTADRSATI